MYNICYVHLKDKCTTVHIHLVFGWQSLEVLLAFTEIVAGSNTWTITYIPQRLPPSE